METEVLVVGTGIAGLAAAASAAEQGFEVTLLSKSGRPEESNTLYAQGGIVYNKGEKVSTLVRDIVRAGDELVKTDIANLIAKEGVASIDDLLLRKAEVPFAKEHGRLSLTREAAHSRRRILYSFDMTGKAIEEALLRYVRGLKNVRLLSRSTAVDILTRDHHTDDLKAVYEKPEALGCYVWNEKSGSIDTILARSVVLATGGIGRIYRHTTNPEIATGDGIGMAQRAGARIINMEYTQFHPTALYAPSDRNFLLSESLRGEGAVIVNREGKEFIRDPRGSLAPRDVVSIAIHNELIATHTDFVYLDLSRMKNINLRERFPSIYRECLRFNIDITRSPIPVVPAFHFSIGGVRVNEWGKTSVARLFAAGECSCTGLHGANRLASTSLLEGLVFGRRIGRWLGQNKKSVLSGRMPRVRDWISPGKTRRGEDPALMKQDWEALRSTMWNYVGIVRSERRLHRAMQDLHNLQSAIEDFYRNNRVSRGILELRNAVQTGILVAQSAWQNRVSRGCHYRID
jgi:L-aspartate oxidase